MTSTLYGGIEAGGTKFVLGVGPSPTEILATHIIPTYGPDETLGQALAWFKKQGALRAFGIASFGPVELDRASSNWGQILNTPKAGWSGCNLAGFFREHLSIPIGFETDVTGAALGEFYFGAGKDSKSLTYVTIGTGIGGGTVVNGLPLQGAGHPELGHIYLHRIASDWEFEGICPFHGSCLEGLASGPAILKRWGSTLSELPQHHEAHDQVAEYIAQACHSIFAMLATQTIVLGGGVMKTPRLLERVERMTERLDMGYLPARDDRCIVAPSLGDRSGLVGALLMAKLADEAAT